MKKTWDQIEISYGNGRSVEEGLQLLQQYREPVNNLLFSNAGIESYQPLIDSMLQDGLSEHEICCLLQEIGGEWAEKDQLPSIQMLRKLIRLFAGDWYNYLIRYPMRDKQLLTSYGGRILAQLNNEHTDGAFRQSSLMAVKHMSSKWGSSLQKWLSFSMPQMIYIKLAPSGSKKLILMSGL